MEQSALLFPSGDQLVYRLVRRLCFSNVRTSLGETCRSVSTAPGTDGTLSRAWPTEVAEVEEKTDAK